MAFAIFHPFTILVYYGVLLLLVSSTKHPLLILIVLAGAILHSFLLYGRKETLSYIFYYLLVTLLIVITSAAFKHNGVTPLFFWNDQPVTKESLIYATALGGLIMAISFIYRNAIQDLPMDKLLFVGRLFWPTVGMFLSMGIRFVPICKERFREMHVVQKTIGYYATASAFDCLVGWLKTLYEAIIWTFDQCFHKSDVMHARGYHLLHKTTFQLYTWHMKDYIALISLAAVVTVFLIMLPHTSYYYFPNLKNLKVSNNIFTMTMITAFIPFLLELKERLKWHYYSLKM